MLPVCFLLLRFFKRKEGKGNNRKYKDIGKKTKQYRKPISFIFQKQYNTRFWNIKEIGLRYCFVFLPMSLYFRLLPLPSFLLKNLNNKKQTGNIAPPPNYLHYDSWAIFIYGQWLT